MKLKSQILLILLFLFSCSVKANSNSATGKIHRISFEASGIAFTLIDNTGELVSFNSSSCENKNTLFHAKTHTNYKVIQASLFAAYQNNTSVTVTASGCTYGAVSLASLSQD